LIGFGVALYAIHVQKHKKKAPIWLSFGWQRAELLGAFFNGGPSLFRWFYSTWDLD
jgi:zinc transporter 1